MNAAFILSKMHCPSQLGFDSNYIEAILDKDGESNLISITDDRNPPLKIQAVILNNLQWNASAAPHELSGSEESVLHSGHSGTYQNVLKRDAFHCERRF